MYAEVSVAHVPAEGRKVHENFDRTDRGGRMKERKTRKTGHSCAVDVLAIRSMSDYWRAILMDNIDRTRQLRTRTFLPVRVLRAVLRGDSFAAPVHSSLRVPRQGSRPRYLSCLVAQRGRSASASCTPL